MALAELIKTPLTITEQKITKTTKTPKRKQLKMSLPSKDSALRIKLCMMETKIDTRTKEMVCIEDKSSNKHLFWDTVNIQKFRQGQIGLPHGIVWEAKKLCLVRVVVAQPKSRKQLRTGRIDL